MCHPTTGGFNVTSTAYNVAFTPVVLSQVMFDIAPEEMRLITYPLNVVGSVISTILISTTGLTCFLAAISLASVGKCTRSIKAVHIAEMCASDAASGLYSAGRSLVNAAIPGFLFENKD